jgi:DNA polymerase III sliding clamp (beta) subunit (PCNA family)
VATADYQSAIQLIVPCNGEWADSVIMPGEWLTKIITHLDGQVTLEAMPNQVRIQAGSFTATVLRVTEDAIPALERDLQEPAVTTVRIPAADLYHILNAALHATPRSDDKQATLNGVLLEPGDHALRAISSDRHRLVMAVSQQAEVQSVGTGVPKRTAIIPRAAITALTKALATLHQQNSQDAWLTIQLGKQRYRLDSKVMRLVGSYLPGPYPDWERVMANVKKSVSGTVSRAELQGALRRATLIADPHDRHAISLTLLPDALSVQVKQEKGESVETIPAQVDAACVDFNVTLDSTLLLPVLNVFAGDRIALTLPKKNHPEPVCLTAPGETAVALVMPIQR